MVVQKCLNRAQGGNEIAFLFSDRNVTLLTLRGERVGKMHMDPGLWGGGKVSVRFKFAFNRYRRGGKCPREKRNVVDQLK